MAIESQSPVTKSNLLKEALLEIAAKIDVPRNSWEQKLIDLAEIAGNTSEQIELKAAEKRYKITKP